MAMVDMREVEADDYARPVSMNSCPTLWLNEEQCEALGIPVDIKAGEEVGIQAVAVVTRATQSIDEDEPGEQDGERDVCITLEVRHMSVGKATAPKEAAKSLYGNEE